MQAEKEKGNRMETMPMGALSAAMSLPMMASLLIQSLYNIVDSVFVARLSEEALTAASLAFPVQMLMIAVGVGTAVGVNAVLSRTLGRGDRKGASETALTGLVLAAFFSLVFTLGGIFLSGPLSGAFTKDPAIAGMCGTYLRICMVFCLGNLVSMVFQRLLQASGRAGLSMAILVTGALTNLVLDPVMIFGLFGFPALGIAGAAWATVIGQWISMGTGLAFNLLLNPDADLSPGGFRLKGERILSICRVGLPTICMQAMTSFMVTAFNAILLPFSTAAVAFFGIYFKLQNFLFMPMNGLGQAAIPIVGYNYGAGKKERVLEAMRILSMTFLPASLTMLSGYLAAGLGDGITNMACALIRQFLPLIPCAFLLARTFGIGAVWYAMWVSEALALTFALRRIRNLKKRLSALYCTENGGTYESKTE